MNSLRFYIFFNIFNILFICLIILCVYISAVLIWDMRNLTIANIKFLCGIALMITYITLKLRLPKIFIKWAKKYDKSIISQFVYYLANRPNIKKKILFWAFCYDLPVLIYIISQYLNYSFIDAIFYITVFYTVDIKGKNE